MTQYQDDYEFDSNNEEEEVDPIIQSYKDVYDANQPGAEAEKESIQEDSEEESEEDDEFFNWLTEDEKQVYNDYVPYGAKKQKKSKEYTLNEEAGIVYDTLRSNPFINLDHHSAAALTGNYIAETGNFDPDVIELRRRGDKGSAYGLAQWRGDRFQNLVKFAKTRGLDIKDIKTQALFSAYELATTEKNAYDKIMQAKGIEGKAAAVDRHYERSDGTTTNQRINNARNVARTYRQGGGYGFDPIGYVQRLHQKNGIEEDVINNDITDFYRQKQGFTTTNSPINMTADVGKLAQQPHLQNINPTKNNTNTPDPDPEPTTLQKWDQGLATTFNIGQSLYNMYNKIDQVKGKAFDVATTLVSNMLNQREQNKKNYRNLERFSSELPSDYFTLPDFQNLNPTVIS